MNTQPIEKSVFHERGMLRLHSLFPTIQGEGPFAGKPAVFVRLAGCNLQCPACDTEYTEGAIDVMPEYIYKEVVKHERIGRLVVLTGGEPFRQNIAPLIEMLISRGIKVQIETNGTLAPSENMDTLKRTGMLTVVCSPKAGKVNEKLQPFITAYKYVLNADSVHKDDGLPLRALGHPANPHVARPYLGFAGTVYVQPVDVKDATENQRHLDACLRSCLKYGYTLCLQLHKIIGME